MKNVVLMSFLLIIMLGASCATTSQEEEPGKQSRAKGPITRERPVEIDSGLIHDDYELFSVIEAKKPISEHAYLLAKSGNAQLEIRETKDVAQIVKAITSPEDALELARLLSSQDLRPFLKDIYYSEIHEKMKGDEKDQWFAIETDRYNAWKLHEPVITEEDGQYKIERFVASYPRIQEQPPSPAQLLKIWEWVDAQGKYSMEIQEVIAEGEEIQKILIFTK